MDLESVKSVESLVALIKSCPLIDNHAHPLLLPAHTNHYPLISVTSEAHGEALDDHVHTLAHFRAVKYLAEWLGCAEDWEAIKKARSEVDVEQWNKFCFQGIQALLLDDGLDKDNVESYQQHDRLTTSPTKRIVRIERVAEKWLEKEFELMGPKKAEAAVLEPGTEFTTVLFKYWITGWEKEITDALEDPEVVGFKSIVCYRSGLDVSDPTGVLRDEEAEFLLQQSFVVMLRKSKDAGWKRLRVDEKPLNDYLVLRLCRIIQELPADRRKPVQFHCGLGDNDLKLQKANPSCLENVMKNYPEVPIVILHSAYPFTREAGYLAANYKNVYLDFGEVFPMLSHDGQKSVVKQMLELTPVNKLLWSSDGHWFPETFALANAQIRDVMSEVLTKRVRRGLLSLQQASHLVGRVFFHNSNELYRLGLKPDRPSETSLWSGNVSMGEDTILYYALKANRCPDVQFIRLQWVDYTALRRLRIVPIESMKKVIQNGSNLSITKAAFSLLQNDWPSSDATPTGKWLLNPDWESLLFCQTDAGGHAVVNCSLLGAAPDEPEIAICPRTALLKAIKLAAASHDIDFLVGFETEVVFLNRETLEPLKGAHAWSTALALKHEIVPCLQEIVATLDRAGIKTTYVHPESATGQFEFVTEPAPPLAAVDALYFTREVVETVGQKYGYKATLHPKPFSHECGNAAHMHISLPTGHEKGPSFYAGILKHLSAVTAFGLASMASYDRLQDGAWAGGTYNTWGEENRETPLRRVDEKDAHWEIRGTDGTSNAFLFLTAVIHAGLDGVKNNLKLPKECTVGPATLSTEQKKELGITQRLPRSLPEALEALLADTELTAAVGKPIIDKYVALKKAEINFMKDMSPEDRRNWMVARY